MAPSGKRRPLENDEQFPSIQGSSVAHGEISVREHTAGSWGVLTADDTAAVMNYYQRNYP